MRPTNLLAAFCAVAALAAGASSASADTWRDGPAHFVGGGIGLRMPAADSTTEAFDDHLEGYGYDTATVGYELRLYGGYRVIPMLDLGIAADYWYRKEGEPRGKTISMRTHSRQLGVFVRPHQRSPGRLLDIGARFEAGYVHSKTTLRGVSLEELSPYARLQLELVLGGGDLAGTLHVSYTLVGGREDFEPYVPPRLGGIAFGVGLLRRF